MKNEPRIEFSDRFNKLRRDAPVEIKQGFLDALALFLTDPMHPALRNHPLHGEYAGYRSFDVTEDYRAIFREEMRGEQRVTIFYKLGTHEQLYGK